MNDNAMNIKNIKLQLKNIETQFDNVEIQMNSMISMNIDSQIENLGIQMLNLVIQTLNILNNMLKNISFNDIAFNKKIEDIITQLKNLKSPIGMNPMENMNNMGLGMGMMGMNAPALLNPPMMMNMMNMNMNFNNLMPINDEDRMKNINEKIDVFFRQSGENNHIPIIISCGPNEKISDIITKYRTKSKDNDKNKKFVFNAHYLNYTLTVAEAGITNNANIFVVETKKIKYH